MVASVVEIALSTIASALSRGANPAAVATATASAASACPNAAPVSEAFCRSEGFGKTGFVCEFRLGEGKRKQTAILMPGEGEWTLADPDKTCVADAA